MDTTRRVLLVGTGLAHRTLAHVLREPAPSEQVHVGVPDSLSTVLTNVGDQAKALFEDALVPGDLRCGMNHGHEDEAAEA